MTPRVYTYRAGRKVCPGCGKPLEGMRRDARGHSACMREVRRERGERLSGARARTAVDGHGEGGARAAEPPFSLACPACGGHLFSVQVRAVTMVVGRERVDGPFVLGSRKVCGWRGSVARARRAVAA